MKTHHCRKHTLTLGEFIESVYDVFGQRKAKGVVRLALDARLIQFQRSHLFMNSGRL